METSQQLKIKFNPVEVLHILLEHVKSTGIKTNASKARMTVRMVEDESCRSGMPWDDGPLPEVLDSITLDLCE